MQRELTGKVIVITGASSGIGAATSLACADAGMDVALGARRKDKLDAVAGQIEQRGPSALAVACDVTEPEQIEALFRQARERFGRIDALFANAGYGIYGSVLETPEADHRAIFEVNYFATLHTLKAGVPHLRDTPGGLKHVLICSSAGSEIGLPMFGAYAATKAAQDSIAGALRGELADEGIAVTSVHPVGTATEFFDTAQARSPATRTDQPQGANTPKALVQPVEHVAKCIRRALRKPSAEVWPMVSARWGLALLTAMPGLAARLMRRHYKRIVPGP